MTTLSCRNLARGCLDTLTAADSKEIQKVFLAHVHAKHQLEWNGFSKQFKAIAIVTVRDRFITQAAEGLKDGIPTAAAPAILLEAGSSASPA